MEPKGLLSPAFLGGLVPTFLSFTCRQAWVPGIGKQVQRARSWEGNRLLGWWGWHGLESPGRVLDPLGPDPDGIVYSCCV